MTLRDSLPATFDEMNGNPPRGFEDKHLHWKCENEDYVPSPCFMCGTPTLWIDLAFQGPLCGPRCEQDAFDEMNRLTTENTEGNTAMPASMEENPREKAEIASLAEHAKRMSQQLEHAANGYGHGRSDDRSNRLREAKRAADDLQEKIERAVA
jgi:hypothetical protein